MNPFSSKAIEKKERIYRVLQIIKQFKEIDMKELYSLLVINGLVGSKRTFKEYLEILESWGEIKVEKNRVMEVEAR